MPTAQMNAQHSGKYWRVRNADIYGAKMQTRTPLGMCTLAVS